MDSLTVEDLERGKRALDEAALKNEIQVRRMQRRVDEWTKAITGDPEFFAQWRKQQLDLMMFGVADPLDLDAIGRRYAHLVDINVEPPPKPIP